MPWEALAKWLGGLVVAVLGWFGIDLHRRVKQLEESRVSREDIDELRHSMMQTFTHGHDKVEAKVDRLIERLIK